MGKTFFSLTKNDNEKSYLGLVGESTTDSHCLYVMARGYCVVCDVGFGLLANMNLYLISQTENNGWDTYDSAVVAAPSEEIAKTMHPNGSFVFEDNYPNWAKSPESVSCQLIGVAVDGTPQGVFCASFNAG